MGSIKEGSQAGGAKPHESMTQSRKKFAQKQAIPTPRNQRQRTSEAASQAEGGDRDPPSHLTEG